MCPLIIYCITGMFFFLASMYRGPRSLDFTSGWMKFFWQPHCFVLILNQKLTLHVCASTISKLGGHVLQSRKPWEKTAFLTRSVRVGKAWPSSSNCHPLFLSPFLPSSCEDDSTFPQRAGTFFSVCEGYIPMTADSKSPETSF